MWLRNLRTLGVSSVTKQTAGPEKPTYWERFIHLIPVPYTAGSLIIAAIIGALGRYLVGYLDFQHLRGAPRSFFSSNRVVSAVAKYSERYSRFLAGVRPFLHDPVYATEACSFRT